MADIKVVINKCYGGFGISWDCILRLAQAGVVEAAHACIAATSHLGPDYAILLKGVKDDGGGALSEYFWRVKDWARKNRDHPDFVRLVEEDGEAMSGECAKLGIAYVTMPEVEDLIYEYDGYERTDRY